MTPPIDKAQINKIARARMASVGIPVPVQRDLDAHIARIIFSAKAKTNKAIANRLVEDCRADYVTLTLRFSAKIKGSKKRKTIRLRGMYWADYLMDLEIGP
ncbi:MAG: hypothetical protein ACYCT1_14345 [Steroidobacteraceae bacterium]|jgi:hypothetical protein